jgi:transmembrane sensor
MKKKLKLKAEDLLMDENYPNSFRPDAMEANEEFGEKDIQLAKRIHSFLTANQISFPEDEKEQTKNRIKTSVKKLQRRKILIWGSSVAAVLLVGILSGIWYSQINSSTELENFAQTLSQKKPGSDTRLILQDGQEVLISKEESAITYAQNGKNITIGTEQKINQQITDQKQSFNTVIVPYGKRTFITLSEGTKVWLNSGSKLVYPAVFAEKKREVYIDGEAVFEVTHSESNPFYVKTRDFDVKVLGTVFNVCAYSDDKNSSAVLERGKVELSSTDKGIRSIVKLSILPGTRAEYSPDKQSFTQQKVNPLDYMSWHEGYLVFNSEKLINILKKINRYYNVEIQLTNLQLQNETFSGYLDLKNTPLQVLDVIAQTTPFNYEYQDEKIVITSKN